MPSTSKVKKTPTKGKPEVAGGLSAKEMPKDQPSKSKVKKTPTKGKPSEVADGLSTEEMSKDQLVENIVRLREELDREREEMSYFQLERDKLLAFWETCKKDLEETKAKLRNRERERREAEERHQVEISVYKEKLKHVLSEQHNAVSGIKMDNVTATSLIQNQNTETELKLQGDVHSLQANYREKMLHQHNCIKELKLKQESELIELMMHYDKRLTDIGAKHNKNVEAALQDHLKKRRAAFEELEKRWESHIEAQMKNHDKALEEVNRAYTEALTRKRHYLHQEEILQDLEKELARKERKRLTAEKELKRLRDALQEAEQKKSEYSKQLEEYNKAKKEEAKKKAHTKIIEKELEDLKLEHWLLQEAFEKAEQERDQLIKKQRETILDMQQQRGLKEMVARRKIAVLEISVERAECQLNAVVAAANLDQDAASSAAKKLQETLDARRTTNRALKEDLAQR
ncbi:dynein regulatory complex subunit 4-like isoform X2 [Cheilinus undulatus]|nr:dynein regulatory complex subunit 4-like isoform X2 [Cheilinus undulatus]